MAFSKRHYRLLSNADTTEAIAWRKRDAEIRSQVQAEFEAEISTVRSAEQVAPIVKRMETRRVELHAQETV